MRLCLLLAAADAVCGSSRGVLLKMSIPVLPVGDASHEAVAGTVGAAEGVLLEQAPTVPWPEPTAAALREQGVVLFENALNPSKAADLRAHCEATLEAATASVEAGKSSEREHFGAVLARHARYDLKLSLESPIVSNALSEALGAIAPVIREALGDGGDCDPFLAELGAIRSTRGAPRQPLHADTRLSDADGPPELLTAFIALQDIDVSMGPTTFLPRTHVDADAHAALRAPETKERLLLGHAGSGRRLGVMNAGAITLYDSRLLHAGGANESPRVRWLLYAGFCRSRLRMRELRGDLYSDLQRTLPSIADFV